jgi:hypothetical protein
MFERGLNAVRKKRNPNPRKIASRPGLASVASLESGIDSGKRM